MRKVTAGDRTWGQGDIRWTPARKFRQCKHCPLHWNYHTSFSSFGRICFPNQWFQTNFFKMLFFCRYNKSSIRLHWSFKEKDQLWGIAFIKFICSSWFEDFNMDPLIKATLLRTFGFILWVFLSTWVFVLIEDTEKDDREESMSCYALCTILWHWNITWPSRSLITFPVSPLRPWANLNYHGLSLMHLISCCKLWRL